MSERYTVRGKIGQGGVGAVYRAYDNSLRREVAIKRLLSGDDTAELLIKEAGMLSKLQHPNIVTVYDVGVDDDGGYVVMELIEGETFDLTVARGALTVTDFAQVADQTLEALIAAQEIDMLHRDLKPSNVMVSWLPSGRFQIKVLDFGLAKLSQTPALQTINHGDSIMGSIYFMAPEQFDRELLDARTDLYSLGCLFYYGLTGSYPFDGQTAPEVMIAHIEHDVLPLPELRPDLPWQVSDWVMRLISKDMDARPSSAAEALQAFDPAIAAIGATVPVPTDTSDVPLPPAPSPNRPRLITGPIEQLTRYPPSPPLHTTAYQMHAKKRGPSAVSVFLWSLLAIGLVAGMVFLVSRPDDPPVAGRKERQPEPPEDVLPESPVEKKPVIKKPPQSAPDPKKVTSKPPAKPGPGKPRGTGGTEKATAPSRALPRTTSNPNQRFVYPTSTWRVLEAQAPPADWKEPEFDASAWPLFHSPIGFGNLISNPLARMADGRITYYLRKRLIVQNAPPPGDPGSFVARIQYDDGFCLYINGVEVLRAGMPDGRVRPGTLAIDRGEDKSKFARFDLSPTILVEGSNLLAVELHQASADDQDALLSMTLDYVAEGESPPKYLGKGATDQ